MNRRLQTQINPKMAAVIILIVLAAVQWFWWRGLVMKPKPGNGQPPSGGSMPPSEPVVTGWEDVMVETLAGTPEPGDADGIGRNARFDGPAGLALDAAGNLYVADSRNHRIRCIAPGGRTTTVAGGEPGYADGPAASARFNLPCGIAVGPNNAVYVADTGNHRIRRIRDGQVTTLAGGAPGMADGAGPAARFNLPCALAFAPGPPAALLVADAGNRRVRVVRLDGVTVGGWATPDAPTAVLASPQAAAVPRAETLLVGGQARRAILVDPLGQAGLSPSPRLALHRPQAVCAAPDGLYVADGGHGAVFHLHGGNAEVLAGLCTSGRHIFGWRDERGDRAYFSDIGALVSDGKGHLYASDTLNNAVRRITLPEAAEQGKEARR